MRVKRGLKKPVVRMLAYCSSPPGWVNRVMKKQKKLLLLRWYISGCVAEEEVKKNRSKKKKSFVDPYRVQDVVRLRDEELRGGCAVVAAVSRLPRGLSRELLRRLLLFLPPLRLVGFATFAAVIVEAVRVLASAGGGGAGDEYHGARSSTSVFLFLRLRGDKKPATAALAKVVVVVGATRRPFS